MTIRDVNKSEKCPMDVFYANLCKKVAIIEKFYKRYNP